MKTENENAIKKYILPLQPNVSLLATNQNSSKYLLRNVNCSNLTAATVQQRNFEKRSDVEFKGETRVSAIKEISRGFRVRCASDRVLFTASFLLLLYSTMKLHRTGIKKMNTFSINVISYFCNSGNTLNY